jgi:ABC-type transport system involved in cytochrome c biogenesis permease subunit
MDWHPLGWLAVALYGAAEAASISGLVRHPARSSLASGLVGAGAVLQFVDLETAGRALHSVPYRTFGGSLSLFGWLLGVSYLILLLRHRERAIGPFLIPFVIVFSLAGLLIPERGVPPTPATQGVLFALHVTFAMLGYAAFTFSFVLSILYLIQNRQIRRGQTGLLFSRLPALEVIGGMNRTSVSVGLAALAASILFGVVWANRVWSTLADPKILFALLTVALYGFLLWMERRGWKGPRVAVLSILGYALVLFSYTVVNLYLSPAHAFR